MIPMHDKEYQIDEGLVHSLLKTQCPQWAQLPLKALQTSGTDHALYRLGKEYVVRLPRIESARENISKEYEWLPQLVKFLKIPISEPLFKGRPTGSYPSFWSIIKWNEGQTPGFEQENEYQALAKDLADFLNQLQDIDLDNGPRSRRGVPLKHLDSATSRALVDLEGELETQILKSLWSELCCVPDWTKKPVWVHGDLLPGNILVQEGRLRGVIDFSDVGIGDPACDLVIAWSLLGARSRQTFRDHLKNIDQDTWDRGRGWALSIALIILPYYKNTNPILVAVAKRMIEQLLAEK